MTSKGYALARAALIRTLTAYSGITTEDGLGDGTTLVDSNLKGRNDFITEKTILIMSGDAKDEDKGATSFDSDTGKITLQGDGFSAQIKAGTIFRMLNISTVEMDVANIDTKIGTNTDDPGTTTLFAWMAKIFAAAALEATLTAIKGAGWTDENLTTIDSLIDTLLTRVTAAVALASVCTEARLAELDAANIPADTDPKVMGRLQIAATTIDLQQAAATRDLVTGTTQDVVIESLVLRCPVDCSDDVGDFTGISIQTDDTTPQVFIAQADGVKANLKQDAQLAWTGAVLLKATKKIQLTIYGGAADDPTVCDIVIKCRAVASGGYLV